MLGEPAPFLPDPRGILSSWRRFGRLGPGERTDAVVRFLTSGDTLFRVHDAVTERRVSEVLTDAEAL